MSTGPRAFVGDLPTQLRTRTSSRLRSAPTRLRLAAIPIVQCAVAAGLAWLIATKLVGHEQPFFAPVAAVVSLGISTSGKVRRSLELLVGVTVGVGVGDLLISHIGSGAWQIALVVAGAIAAAVALDAGPVITVQSASSAVLVATLMPPGDGANLSRMVDAFVGGSLGLLVLALIPTHPLGRARREAAGILTTLADVLDECAAGLTEQSTRRVESALTVIRGTQAPINALRQHVRGGREISRIAPLYWHSRPQLVELTRAVDALDNAVRNSRVLVRRSLALVRQDEILDIGLIDEVEKLAHASRVLSTTFRPTHRRAPDVDATRVLRLVAKGARPDLVAGAGLSAHTIYAQLRSTIVDLLEVAGVPRTTGIAMLPPMVAQQ